MFSPGMFAVYKFSTTKNPKILASNSRKFDVHTHILPKNIPDFEKVNENILG